MADQPIFDADVEDDEEAVGIAVVGMAGRFPGAPGVTDLWRTICAGESGITRFTEEELRAAGVPQELIDDPDYVRAGAVVDGVEDFDADFFGIGSTEAQIIDPQHRLFLEHCWEALEDAGCDPSRFDGTIGVFAGCAISSYMTNNLADSEAMARLGELTVGLGNDKDSLTTRAAHTLGLGGPSYTIQSYCSTSLVAVCAAASSLAACEGDLILAGGVAVSVPHRVGYLYQPGGIAPPDGECRAFDAAGLGAPLGNGVGVVALRRLSDALENGDRIYAVIRGWATNNDAGRKVGFTAPGVQGQAAVIEEALGSSGLTAADIDYVEAHGTGTALGDAVELSALQQVFDGESVRIGSVKTNVGHLDRAAGVTNLIKASLALHHDEIPPTRNLGTPNEQLSAGGADIEVVTSRTPWPARPDRLRRAGVSSFGIGGTNAHVVVEEAPRPPHAGGPDRAELMVWSARSAAAADAMTSRLAEHVSGDVPAGDVAYTLQTGRRVFEHRRMLVVPPGQDAADVLRARGPVSGEDSRTDREVAFLVAGTGDHRPGMAADLYRAEPVFAGVLDDCRAELVGLVDGGETMLRDPLGWTLHADREPAPELLDAGVFTVHYAMGRLLGSWGIRPSLMAGDGVGEYVAACLSGVLTPADALALLVHRAELVGRTPAGATASVPLPAAELLRRIDAAGIDGVDTAAVHGPELTVIAGPPDAVRAVGLALGADAIPCRPVPGEHALHSRMLEPVADELTERVARTITPRPPEIPYLSAVTGEPVTESQVLDPAYWAQQMCAPVQLDTMLGELLRDPERALLEIGPGRTVTGSVRGRPDCPPSRWPTVVSALPDEDDPRADVLLTETLGRLWLAGVPVDWDGYQAGRPVAKTGLPTYPFQRRRYWIEPTPRRRCSEAAARTRRAALLEPLWTEDGGTGPGGGTGTVPPRCVLLADRSGAAEALAGTLRDAGADVTVASDVDGGADGTAVVVDLRLLDDLASGEETDGTGADAVAAVAARLDAVANGGPARVVLVTRNGQAVRDGERPSPGHAAAAALCVVANQEYADLSCRAVDVGPDDDAAAAVHAELCRDTDDVLVAHREGKRFVPEYRPTTPGTDAQAAVRPGGTYLVTGGLGGVGLTVARHLAEAGAGTLVLTSRTGLPDDPAHLRATAVRELRTLGARVLTPAVDVTDEDAMRSMLAGTVGDGKLDGVVHAAAATGLDTFRALSDTDAAVVADHFAAKVGGALVLRRLLDERPLEAAPGFCALFSSTSALLGGITFGSYAAANAALSAVGHEMAARHRAGATPTRWVTGCWDPWGSTVADLDGPDGATTMGAELARLAMTEPEALAAFDGLVSGVDGCRVVTVAGLDDRMPRAGAPAQAPATTGDRFPRPDLAAPYVAPSTGTERTVAELWSAVLGVEPVGADDAFFDLGGNSLLSVQMTGLVRKRLGGSVPPVALLEAPTARAFAALLDEQGVAVPQERAPAAVPEPRPDRESGGPGASGVDAYLPSWRPRTVPLGDLDARLRAAGPWMLLVDDERGEDLVERLAVAGAEAVVVRPGDTLSAEAHGDFTLPVGEPGRYAELLRAQVVAPRTVVAGFSLADGGNEAAHADLDGRFAAAQERGLRSVLDLVDAFAAEHRRGAPAVELVVLTSGALGVLGPDAEHPEHGALAGLPSTPAADDPFLTCRHVDVDAEPDVEQTLAAVVGGHDGTSVVRSGGTWLRHYEPLPAPPDGPLPLVGARDTVLVTDGLGGTGRPIARHLARAYGCRLVLTGGETLPPREQWDRLDDDDPAAATVADVRELEDAGATVRVLAADPADESQLGAAVDAAAAEFGGIDVVVHAAEPVPAEPAASCRAAVHDFRVLDSVLTDHAVGRRVVVLTQPDDGGRRSHAATNAALGAQVAAARLGRRGHWTTVEPAPWLPATARQEPAAMVERALATEHVATVVVATTPPVTRHPAARPVERPMTETTSSAGGAR
ncbi:type I polyketide synthase [Pseudonocardia endophytica]|uniref:Acyl transferase domain-containing protein n=1 Tax=Pseudonocardia endophytica TaxID=401976 RepID=A0A4R1HIZ9_PSEEN|nr:type I polyketide synthase [Pseudonocardia endophytica]TCK22284.1 acyl transferase domain-containing protein [Pseudonocardia endophytica]